MRKFVEDRYGVHALKDGEFTLCGVVADINEDDTGNLDEIPEETHKRVVTCPLCIAYIKACRGLRFKDTQ